MTNRRTAPAPCLAWVCAALAVVATAVGAWRLRVLIDGLRHRTTASMLTLPLREAQPVDLPVAGPYVVSIRCPFRTPMPDRPGYRLISSLSGYEVKEEPMRQRDHRVYGMIGYSHAAFLRAPQSGPFALRQLALPIRCIAWETATFTAAFCAAIGLVTGGALILRRRAASA